jgi:GNAT superfamily N-acetyltransferase
VPATQVPAPGVTVRPARPDDTAAAALVFRAAAPAYTKLAGSERRARQIVERLWPRPGHSASFEHALVAEIDGRVVGVFIGFPERERYRLHAALLHASLRHVPPKRWPLLVAGLPLLVLATPRPPRGSYYVGTIAVAWHARWRGVASILGRHAEIAAARRGFEVVVAHTGTGHTVARRALENYGFTLEKARRKGYALYSKPVSRILDLDHS